MHFKAGKKAGQGAGARHQDPRKPEPPHQGKPGDRGDEGPNDHKGPAFKQVVLELHSVECIETTKEIDKDEMVLVGIAANAIRRKDGRPGTKSEARAPIGLGKFKKGTKQTFENPRSIVTFAYGGAQAGWPRSYPAALLLVEKDEGKIGTLAAAVADAIDEEVAQALEKAATTAAASLATGAAGAIGAGAAAGSVVPLIGTAVGAAVAAGVLASMSAIKKAKVDDAFPPRPAPLDLRHPPARPGEVAGTRETHVLSAHGGKYRLVTSWSVA